MSLTISGAGVTAGDYYIDSSYQYNSNNGTLYIFTGTKEYTIAVSGSGSISDMYIWLVGGGGGGGQGSPSDEFDSPGAIGAGGGGGGVINGTKIDSFSAGTFIVGAGGQGQQGNPNPSVNPGNTTEIALGVDGDGLNYIADGGLGANLDTAGDGSSAFPSGQAGGNGGDASGNAGNGQQLTINSLYVSGGGAPGNFNGTSSGAAGSGANNYGSGGNGGAGGNSISPPATHGNPGVIYVWFASGGGGGGGGTVPDGGLNGPIPCFLQGSKILCSLNDQDTYLPIEQMKPGTLVKTSDNSYRRVKLIGYSDMINPGSNQRLEHRLYVCRKETYPELEDNLYLTGNHSILVSRITDEEKEQLLKNMGDIFVTSGKYRLVAFIDKRSEPWVSEGKYTVWHIALESDNDVVNYGVYANGLLVETACIQTLRDKSCMRLL